MQEAETNLLEAMKLRPYQSDFVTDTQRSLIEYDRILGVAPTGSGKTITSAEIAKRWRGKILFLADAKELVWQAADKITSWTGEICAIEMAQNKIDPRDDPRIAIATTQSIARRLDKYPRDYFGLIIIDEAHRNTLGTYPQRVLGHFNEAKVLGITATPFRSDKQELGSFYEAITHEIGLIDLIKKGYLSRITVKSVPAGISISKVRTTAGDYNEKDLGNAIEPHLIECAELLKEHASDRKTVVFLPLIKTSKAFCEACNNIGLNAVHVDGVDREDLELFRNDQARVICNASLLTTGWDQPDVDCVYILRPTKSFVLYSQMVGRGTRIFEGKKDLLLLDPMFLTEQQNLIRAARLIARDEEEAQSIQKRLDLGEEKDVLEASHEARVERTNALRKRLAETAKRKSRTIDYIQFCLTLNEDDLADYQPVMRWESQPMSEGQRRVLEKNGFDCEQIRSKGLASKVLDVVFRRMDLKLASPKQVKWLIRFNHPRPHEATFQEASEFLDKRFNGGRKSA